MADHQLHERFLSVLETNIGIILKISNAYTRTSHDREDLISDIAFEMWKAYPNFKGKSSISTWIYRVALNTAMNFNRRNRKNKDFIQKAIELHNSDPLGDNEGNPQMDLLHECIAELDAFSKAIVLLYLDGYKHDEIAKITGISRTNVGTRISRIKEQLRNRANAKQVHHGT